MAGYFLLVIDNQAFILRKILGMVRPVGLDVGHFEGYKQN